MRTLPAILLIALPLAVGCDESQQQRIMRLQQELAVCQTENAELAQQADQLRIERDNYRDQAAAVARMTPEQWDLLPKVERLEIGRHSGIREGRPQLFDSPATQPDGSATDGRFVRLYVSAVDRDGFNVRPAARISIRLYDLGGEPPRSLGSYNWDVKESLARYRSVLGPDLFAFDLPLPDDFAGDSVTARVELNDMLTGRLLKAEKMLTTPAP